MEKIFSELNMELEKKISEFSKDKADDINEKINIDFDLKMKQLLKFGKTISNSSDALDKKIFEFEKTMKEFDNKMQTLMKMPLKNKDDLDKIKELTIKNQKFVKKYSKNR